MANSEPTKLKLHLACKEAIEEIERLNAVIVAHIARENELHEKIRWLEQEDSE